MTGIHNSDDSLFWREIEAQLCAGHLVPRINVPVQQARDAGVKPLFWREIKEPAFMREHLVPVAPER